jgi:hypothetical protein
MTAVEINGIMLVSDDFNRLRLLLVDEAPAASDAPARNGPARDSSAWRLRSACAQTPGFSRATALPFDLKPRPDADGAWGACTIVAPARHRAHWLAEAARLRGRRVRATVRPRRYLLRDRGEPRPGISLDLVELTELANLANLASSTSPGP